jgi:peptide/nickel transport system substrate-binding protein
MRTLSFAATAVGAALSAMPISAGPQDNTLTIAFPRELESLDAYRNASREGVILAQHIWDALLYRDAETGAYTGNLATGWQWLDDTTLEVTLREGVSFHNGEPFNADDVVFTLNYVADPENGANPQRNVSWIDHAEKIDDVTVRIHTDGPFPAALEFLSGPLVMYPDTYFAEVGQEGMASEPVGTGPYELIDYTPGQRMVLERYEDYHAGGPKGEASIDTIIWRTIPDANTQLAELMSGGVDWVWQVPADQAERLERMDDLTVSNESTMRIGYLMFDASDRYGPTPFDDVRVRRAVAHSIDRQGIVDNLLRGASVVVHSACFPSQFGCDTDVVRYEYDPERARALLDEAGYPEGFDTPFYAYRNRDMAEAMMADLANVGIDAALNYGTYAATRDQIHAGDVPFAFMTWGSYSLNDVSAITSAFFGGGPDDYARDPEVIAALAEGDTATDAEARIAAYSRALNTIASEVYWLPLFSYNTNYAYSSRLAFTPTQDEIPRFYNAAWENQ